nr:uncharacterized protein LOC129439801 [Misgurnus anguillicaudatus]
MKLYSRTILTLCLLENLRLLKLTLLLLDPPPSGPPCLWTLLPLDPPASGPYSLWTLLPLDPPPSGSSSLWTPLPLDPPPSGPSCLWTLLPLDPPASGPSCLWTLLPPSDDQTFGNETNRPSSCCCEGHRTTDLQVVLQRDA